MAIQLQSPERSREPARSTDKRRMSPYLLFLAAYAGYNLIGLIDMPWIISGAYNKSLSWSLFLTGLGGFLLGYFLFRAHRQSAAPLAVRPRTSKQLSGFFLLIFISCVAGTIIANRGIPLLMGESRFGNSAIASNLAPLYGFWLLVRAISD